MHAGSTSLIQNMDLGPGRATEEEAQEKQRQQGKTAMNDNAKLWIPIM
jgi:hypothetical protein